MLVVGHSADVLETVGIVGDDNPAVGLEEPRDETLSTVLIGRDECEEGLTEAASGAHEPDAILHTNEETAEAEDVLVPGIDESDAISLADTVMSVGDSLGEDSTPPSTCGSSASTHENRKRVAEESPDRDREGTSRRDFPGRVTRSAAGCRIYVPPIVEDTGDCPGRVLNDDGTFTIRTTLGQGVEGVLPSVERFTSTTPRMEEIAEFAQMPGADDEPGSSGRDAPLAHVSLFGLPAGIDRGETAISTAPCNVAAIPTTVAVDTGAIAAPNQITGIADEWGRDTCIIDEMCAMIEGMPHPWSAYRAFEAATARFPNIDRAALRLAVMAVLMGQRRCVNRLANASWVSGARRNEDGATYLEFNNACAIDYRNAY